MFSATAASAVCPTFTTFANGDVANANQVMDNFNYILDCPGFAGHVGIGASPSSATLKIQASSALLNLQSTGTSASYQSINNGGGYLYVGEESVTPTILSGALPYAGVISKYSGVSANNALQVGTNDTVRMTIANGGSIGIGTSTPTFYAGYPGGLDIHNSYPALAFSSTGTSTHTWQIGSGAYSSTAVFEIYDGTASASRLSVDGVGNVRIGAGLPTFFAGYAGGLDIHNSYPALALSGTGASTHTWQIGSGVYSSTAVLEIYDATASATRFSVDGTGNVRIGAGMPAQKLDAAGTIRQSNCTTAGTLSTNTSGDIICTSDARLKNIRGGYEGGLDAILRITPRRFTYKPTRSDPIETFVHADFIAQYVKEVIPEAVALQRSGYYSLDATAILAASVNAIKELKTDNDRQSADMHHLRGELASEVRARSRQDQEIGALKASLLMIQQRLRTQTALN